MTLGEKQLLCRMMLIKTGKSKLPDFKVIVKGHKDPMKGINAKNGNFEYQLSGNQQVTISWTHE